MVQNSSASTNKCSKRDLDLVTIKIGHDAVPFVFSKPFLCSRSEYLTNIINSNSKPGEDHEITLSDVSVETFVIFTHWLEHDTLRIKDHENGWNVVDQNQVISTRLEGFDLYGELLNVYIFGASYSFLKLSYRVLVLWKRLDRDLNTPRVTLAPITMATFVKAFQHLAAFDPLCQMLLPMAARDLSLEDLEYAALPPTFWHELYKLEKRRSKNLPRETLRLSKEDRENAFICGDCGLV